MHNTRHRTARVLIACTVLAALATNTPAFARAADSAESSTLRAAGPPAGPSLQAAIENIVRLGVPGVAVLRRVDDSIELGAAGVGDIAAGTPLTVDTAFRTGSVAKTFVATVMLQLVGDGVLSLDDTLGRWLPGLVPGADDITVRQLLGNRSGLFDFIEDPRALAPYLAGDSGYVWTPEELVAIAVSHAPNFAPGTAALYSNTDYTLVGMIIERATSHTVADEVSARIIEPLGLSHTSLPVTADISAPYAHGYAVDLDMVDVTAIHPSLSSFGGNLVSTLTDLATFFDALYSGRLLPADLLIEMESTTTSTSGEVLGLGLQSLELPCGRFIGHSGSTPGYKAAAFHSVESDRVFVILANSLTQTDAVGSPEASRAFEAAAIEAACGPSGQ